MHYIARTMALRVASAGLLLAMIVAGCQSPQPPPPTGLNAAQIATLKELGFKPVDDGWELGLSDKLLFATNEDRLADGQWQSIGRLTGALLSVEIRRARVEGHTDSSGTAAYNDALSLRRASAVADAMVDAGIRPEDLRVQGLGARYPIVSNTDAAGRRENRRVAIIVAAE